MTPQPIGQKRIEMKKNITITLSLIVLFIVGTQHITAQDATANKILGKVSATYQTYKTIKAGFSISINNTQTKSKIKQNGTLYLKGKKFKITLSDQEIYCDGKTMWTYFKEENEVQITKFDANAQDINPSEIFTIFKKGFNNLKLSVYSHNIRARKFYMRNGWEINREDDSIVHYSKSI